MNKPLMLHYNLQEDRAREIGRVVRALGISPRAVAQKEYHQPLAALCGLAQMAQGDYEGPGFEEEMLVMAFFPQGLLGQMLDAIRGAGLRPVALKAVLTENNSRWDSVALNEELKEEYAYFQRLHEARQQGSPPPEQS